MHPLLRRTALWALLLMLMSLWSLPSVAAGSSFGSDRARFHQKTSERCGHAPTAPQASGVTV